jgi:hypothetical protein
METPCFLTNSAASACSFGSAGDQDQGHAAGGELPGKITAYARRRSVISAVFPV